jgi:predicted RNase H-like HicB family nuclease
MGAQPQWKRKLERKTYTVVAQWMGHDAWHVTVRELPFTWTVAFGLNELESRARERIALDLGVSRQDFDVTVEYPALRLQRRADRR